MSRPTREITKEYIRGLVFRKGSDVLNSTLLRSERPDIMEVKTFLNEKYGEYTSFVPEQIYLFLNDLPRTVLCSYCNNNAATFYSYNKGYNDCCKSVPCIVEKRGRTNIVKYGHVNPFGSEEIKDKIKAVCLDKYGVEHHTMLDSVQEKKKATNLERYGAEHPLQVVEFQDKFTETMKDRYGVEHASHLEEFKEKSRKTSIERYGVAYTFQADIVKERIRATMMRRYGVEYSAQMEKRRMVFQQLMTSPDALEKSKQTCIRNYGVDHPMRSEIVKERSRQTNLLKYGFESYNQIPGVRRAASIKSKRKHYHKKTEMLKDTHVFLFTEKEYIEGEKYFKFPMKCVQCNTEYTSHILDGIIPRCPTCFPYTKSTGESELKEFLEDLGLDVHAGRRDIIHPKEIDLFIPERKLGIEFNGIFWHCSLQKEPDYHQNKTNSMEDGGHRLIHVYEDQWYNKKEIIKSRLKTILGYADIVIAGRDTVIRELSSPEARAFFLDNHIQGHTNGSLYIGLEWQGHIAAAMSFGKPRFRKDCDWELLRFCNKLNTRVRGGAGKLMKYFERKIEHGKIVSYADRSWSNGNLYDKLGFTRIKSTEPGYFYVSVAFERIHRLQMTKENIRKNYPKFEPDMNEEENAYLNNVFKIYDSGQLVYGKKI